MQKVWYWIAHRDRSNTCMRVLHFKVENRLLFGAGQSRGSAWTMPLCRGHRLGILRLTWIFQHSTKDNSDDSFTSKHNPLPSGGYGLLAPDPATRALTHPRFPVHQKIDV